MKDLFRTQGHKERNTSSSAVAMGLAGTPLVQDWQQYRQYKPGTHQPASGNHANLVKQSAAKPAVFRGEHGLPYVTDNAHVRHPTPGPGCWAPKPRLSPHRPYPWPCPRPRPLPLSPSLYPPLTPDLVAIACINDSVWLVARE